MQESIDYTNLSTASWAQGNRDIHYSYDDNGSLTEKITAIKDEPDPQTNFEEKVTNTYNLQNRLAQIVRQYDDANDKIEEFTEYTYNDDGIRVSKHTWSEINDTHQNDDVTVVYLIDLYNHTGYAQTLEEKTYNGTDTSGEPDSLTTYLIGDDVIAQALNGTTQYLLYDGHGSTRQLAEYDTAVSIVETFSYNGYGVLLQNSSVAQNDPGKVAPQATNLLYAGEQFDASLQMYYNRARYYDQNIGRFNRMDPYAGNTQDPQSLHKYLYVHANPINNIDPTGNMEFSLTGMFTVAMITGTITGIMAGAITAIKGGTVRQVIDASTRWFWIGFAAGAAIYGGIWAVHSLWLLIFGGGGTATTLSSGTDVYRVIDKAELNIIRSTNSFQFRPTDASSLSRLHLWV